MDDAIDKTDKVAAPHVEDNGEQRKTAQQEVNKEIRGVSEYLLEVHGLPPDCKGEGVTRVIYENLNGLQSTLSKNEKLDKAQQITMKETCSHILHSSLRQGGACRGLDANNWALREMVVGIRDRSRAGKWFSKSCLFTRNEILRRDLLAHPPTSLDGSGTGQNRMA